MALDGSAIAPTVADIVASPARMERCAAAIVHVFAVAEIPPTAEDEDKLEVRQVSEADVLLDLVRFAAEGTACNRPEDKEFVSQLHRTTFIDAEAMNQGAQATAQRWIELLDTLPSLNVMVTRGKSAVVVFDRAMSVIEREFPELLPRILPLQRVYGELPPPSDELVARLQTGHTILVDDWARKANQMLGSVDMLRGLGVPAANLEVNLVCAPGSLLDTGIGGVACRVAFCMPEPVPTRSEECGTRVPSMAGSHSTDDGGFKDRISSIFSPDIGGGRPLIADRARAYGPDLWYVRNQQLSAPDSYWGVVARLEQRVASIPEPASFS